MKFTKICGGQILDGEEVIRRLGHFLSFDSVVKLNRSMKTVSYKDRIPVGPPRLTDFEKARIIGIRAIQIQMGSPLFVDPGKEKDPIRIAEIELYSGRLPLSIKRVLPGKRDYPPIPVKWLLEAEKEDLNVQL